jgi:hypothetical protein
MNAPIKADQQMVFQLHNTALGIVVMSKEYIEGITKKGVKGVMYREWCVFEFRFLLHRHVLEASRQNGKGSLVCYLISYDNATEEEQYTPDTFYKDEYKLEIPPVTCEELGFESEKEKKWFNDWRCNLEVDMRDFMTHPYTLPDVLKCPVFSLTKYGNDVTRLWSDLYECLKKGDF